MNHFRPYYKDDPYAEDLIADAKEKKEEEMDENKGIVKVEPIVTPAVSTQEALDAWRRYEDLKAKIVTDNDVQKIQGKDFLKKSYWRKIATFFNLSVELIEEKSETFFQFDKEIRLYHFRAKAIAPNGRFAEGTGSCDIYDHATIKDDKFCIWDDKLKSWKEAKPKSIHTARTTAETRAWNRAVSNLVGGGEVSAEEMNQSEPTEVNKIKPVKSQPQPKGDLTTVLQFGKYKGLSLAQIDAKNSSYLPWLLEQSNIFEGNENKELRSEIEEFLDAKRFSKE